MRLIDADALEREGWSLQRTYRKDKETMVYEVKAISEIQTAQSEQKTGKWISQDYNQRHGNISTTVYYYPKCSVCGCSGDYTDAFCKSCGADMRGGTHED